VVACPWTAVILMVAQTSFCASAHPQVEKQTTDTRDTAETHDKDKAKQADIPSAPDAEPEQSSHQGFAG
jgi:hypothetical protein